MKKLMLFLQTHPLFVACLAFAISLVGLYAVPTGSIEMQIANRAIMSAIMLIIMLIMGGWSIIRPSSKGFAAAFKISIYLFTFMIVASLATMTPLFAKEATFNPQWLAASIGSIVFALFVGLFEETLFRGIILNSLLAKIRAKKSTVLIAVIISALLFGILHVLSSVISGYIVDFSSLWEILQKVWQTAAFGFFIAAVYLRTKNIWAVSLIHALNDILPFLAGAMMTNVPVSDEMAPVVEKIVTTSAVIQPIFFIPLVIIGLMTIKKSKGQLKGLFKVQKAK